MKQINFHVEKRDYNNINRIADRAVTMAKQSCINYDKMSALMDLTAVHANGCPLRLETLAESTDGDFAHDVFGIRQNLNRKTGQLENFFVPRYAVTQ
jgi:hypothetical protein